MSVCVCLSACISRESYAQTSVNFLCMFPAAMAQSSGFVDDDVIREGTKCDVCNFLIL